MALKIWGLISNCSMTCAMIFIVLALFLRMAACKNTGHEAQHVRRADIAVAIVPDQPALDYIDLFLRRLVHHAGHEAGQLDRVLLVLEELHLEGLLQPLIGLVIK